MALGPAAITGTRCVFAAAVLVAFHLGAGRDCSVATRAEAMLDIRACVRMIVRMPPTTHEERVELRVKPEDLKRWRATAESHGMTLSEWIRTRCDEVAVSDELIEAVDKKLAERQARLQPEVPMTADQHQAHNQRRRKESMRKLAEMTKDSKR
jgi:hypothetical protein